MPDRISSEKMIITSYNNPLFEQSVGEDQGRYKPSRHNRDSITIQGQLLDYLYKNLDFIYRRYSEGNMKEMPDFPQYVNSRNLIFYNKFINLNNIKLIPPMLYDYTLVALHEVHWVLSVLKEYDIFIGKEIFAEVALAYKPLLRSGTGIANTFPKELEETIGFLEEIIDVFSDEMRIKKLNEDLNLRRPLVTINVKDIYLGRTTPVATASFKQLNLFREIPTHELARLELKNAEQIFEYLITNIATVQRFLETSLRSQPSLSVLSSSIHHEEEQTEETQICATLWSHLLNLTYDEHSRTYRIRATILEPSSSSDSSDSMTITSPVRSSSNDEMTSQVVILPQHELATALTEILWSIYMLRRHTGPFCKQDPESKEQRYTKDLIATFWEMKICHLDLRRLDIIEELTKVKTLCRQKAGDLSHINSFYQKFILTLVTNPVTLHRLLPKNQYGCDARKIMHLLTNDHPAFQDSSEDKPTWYKSEWYRIDVETEREIAIAIAKMREEAEARIRAAQQARADEARRTSRTRTQSVMIPPIVPSHSESSIARSLPKSFTAPGSAPHPSSPASPTRSPSSVIASPSSPGLMRSPPPKRQAAPSSSIKFYGGKAW